MEVPWESRRRPSGMALRVRGGFFEEGPARAQSWASRLGQEGLSVRDLSVGLSSYLGRKFISALNTVDWAAVLC